ncbi:hypothetical protein NXC24_PB00399 (plasmid) [Rhizobium sp. NXC24]|nr:hypothetical protein NXC24_PB00399 [Rhizobium sp. NXC24]
MQTAIKPLASAVASSMRRRAIVADPAEIASVCKVQAANSHPGPRPGRRLRARCGNGVAQRIACPSVKAKV